MATRRMLAKSISISKQANSLSLFSKHLFTWLIPHADDFGRMSADPAVVKALVLPMEYKMTIAPGMTQTIEVTVELVAAGLQEIQASGLIIIYEVNGEECLQFPKWEDHQTGLHKRTASKHPEYTGDSRKFPEVPGNSQPTEQNLTELNRTEPNGTADKSAGVVASSLESFNKRYDSLQPGTVTSAVKDRLKSYLEKYGAQELDVVFDAAADMKAMGKLSNPLGFIRNVLEKRRVERDSQPKAPDKSIYGVDITPHNPNGLPPHCRINTGKGWLDPDEALERGFMDKALYDKCMAELEAIAQKRKEAA
jgi:hypothetical protein